MYKLYSQGCEDFWNFGARNIMELSYTCIYFALHEIYVYILNYICICFTLHEMYNHAFDVTPTSADLPIAGGGTDATGAGAGGPSH